MTVPIMVPTTELRLLDIGDHLQLQQKWIVVGYGGFEWRKIPIVQYEDTLPKLDAYPSRNDSRWIRMSERRPPDTRDQILVYDVVSKDVMYVSTDWRHIRSDSITHWMPLPPPPSE